MTQNTVEFMRKYADLISESQQPQQLDEGVVDTLNASKDKILKMFTPQELQQIAATAKQATGGDMSLTADNAKKVGAEIVGSAPAQSQTSAVPAPVSEDGKYGIARTTAGKLKQAAYALGMVGAGAAIATGGAVAFPVGLLALFIGSFALQGALDKRQIDNPGAVGQPAVGDSSMGRGTVVNPAAKAKLDAYDQKYGTGPREY
jgi:hypothetical protein